MTESRTYQVDDYRARERDLYASVKFETVSRYLGTGRRLRVLNIGCGSGEANMWLAQAGHRVDACDPDETAVAMSRDLKARHGLDTLTVRQGGIDELAPGATYDCVFMLDVLEHLADDEKALRIVHGLLKPDGLLCLSVPALPVLFGYHDVMLGHYRRYTRRSVARMAAPYFTPLILRHFGFFLIPVAFVVSRLLQRPYPIAASGRPGALSRLLGLVLEIEARVAFPVGTSLLFVGRRRSTP